MKTLAIAICLLALLCCVAMTLTLKGEQHLLSSMQSIQHGQSQNEVLEIMGDEMTRVPAAEAPQWIRDVTANHETGEFWYYYMGYPSQNMIIYFDDKGSVIYTTWTST